jgi:hypothetical protein
MLNKLIILLFIAALPVFFFLGEEEEKLWMIEIHCMPECCYVDIEYDIEKTSVVVINLEKNENQLQYRGIERSFDLVDSSFFFVLDSLSTTQFDNGENELLEPDFAFYVDEDRTHQEFITVLSMANPRYRNYSKSRTNEIRLLDEINSNDSRSRFVPIKRFSSRYIFEKVDYPEIRELLSDMQVLIVKPR